MKLTFIRDNVAETYENLNPGDKASKNCAVYGAADLWEYKCWTCPAPTVHIL